MDLKTALLSVANKTGVVELARGLQALGYRLVSTGGTAAALAAAGLPITGVSELTGFPELLDGRVKTLHPSIYAGILARRDVAAHRAELSEQGLSTIDLVAVNLYPFKHTVSRAGATLDEAIENIDIGGVTLLRAAAKNYQDVIVMADPAQYSMVLGRLQATGEVPADVRRELAWRAFAHTAAYDAYIARYLSAGEREDRFPDDLVLLYEKVQNLRYGENPHQAGAFYRDAFSRAGLAGATQLGGLPLSYNNLADADAALGLVREFEVPAAVAIKHHNPSGVGIGPDLATAFARARDCDPVSIYGGIVAVNRVLDRATALLMAPIFLEVVLAPAYAPEACEVLAKKRNLRLLEVPVEPPGPEYDLRRVCGGVLWQDRDTGADDRSAWKIVTHRSPTSEELAALRLAWTVAKHTKSNAIVVATPEMTLGVGAGQMNRVTSARLATAQAGERARGAAMASDAMIPFPDTVEVAAGAGIAALIQPGGSLRDQEVIELADVAGMAMVFTGRRHFRH